MRFFSDGKEMKIIRLLFEKSGKLFITGAIASVFTGASSAGLIALINYILQNIEEISRGIVIGFISLCLLLMISLTKA